MLGRGGEGFFNTLGYSPKLGVFCEVRPDGVSVRLGHAEDDVVVVASASSFGGSSRSRCFS